MVAPLQLRDPALQRAYVALAQTPRPGAADVDKLLAAARADDGRIDTTERQDLARVLEHNRGLFTPELAARLEAGAASGDAFGLDLGARRPDLRATLGFTPAPADATRVAPRPMRLPARAAATPDATPRRERPLAPADHTAVRLPVVDPRQPSLSPLARQLPADFRPPQHTLSAADPEAFSPSRRRADEARQRAQASVDQACALDPFAAGVNGMWQSPSGHWERVGPSPLEVASQAAFVGTVPGRVYSAVTAGKAVYTAATDPTAGNIGTAVLKVGLTGGGEWAKLVHSPIKPAITLSKGLYGAQTTTPRTTP